MIQGEKYTFFEEVDGNYLAHQNLKFFDFKVAEKFKKEVAQLEDGDTIYLLGNKNNLQYNGSYKFIKTLLNL